MLKRFSQEAKVILHCYYSLWYSFIKHSLIDLLHLCPVRQRSRDVQDQLQMLSLNLFASQLYEPSHEKFLPRLRVCVSR